MRGMDRDEFLVMLGESRRVEEAVVEAEPLPAKPEEFWGAKALPADLPFAQGIAGRQGIGPEHS